MNVTARSNALRIAIADDHPLMRAALASALADLATDVQADEIAADPNGVERDLEEPRLLVTARPAPVERP